MTRPARFPHVAVDAADPLVRGVQLGRAMRAQIDAALDLYETLLVRSTGRTWADLLARARSFHAPIEAYDPDIAREIEGIATGARRELDEILALNVRTELMYGLADAPGAECTSLFAGPAATGGPVLLAQNWDWRDACSTATMTADLSQGTRPRIFMVAEAGIVGKMGFNDRGIGVAMNLLVSDVDRGQPGVPVHVMLRGILNSGSWEEALDAVTRAERAGSSNLVLACADGRGVDLETAPGGPTRVWRIEPRDGVLAHANHFQCEVGVADALLDRAPDSPLRSARAAELLGTAAPGLDRAAVMATLADHRNEPHSICKHLDPQVSPLDQSVTLASCVFDLGAGNAWVAAGPPCEVAYEQVTAGFGKEVIPEARRAVEATGVDVEAEAGFGEFAAHAAARRSPR